MLGIRGWGFSAGRVAVYPKHVRLLCHLFEFVCVCDIWKLDELGLGVRGEGFGEPSALFQSGHLGPGDAASLSDSRHCLFLDQTHSPHPTPHAQLATG